MQTSETVYVASKANKPRFQRNTRQYPAFDSEFFPEIIDRLKSEESTMYFRPTAIGNLKPPLVCMLLIWTVAFDDQEGQRAETSEICGSDSDPWKTERNNVFQSQLA